MCRSLAWCRMVGELGGQQCSWEFCRSLELRKRIEFFETLCEVIFDTPERRFLLVRLICRTHRFKQRHGQFCACERIVDQQPAVISSNNGLSLSVDFCAERIPA